MSVHVIEEKSLDHPIYTAAEASRLVDLSAVRVRRWLQGYTYDYDHQQRRQRPVIKRTESAGTSYASFLDLVDLLFAKKFVEHGLSLQRLRKALDEATKILKTPHFARQVFFTDGREIYLQVKEEGDAILQLLSGGQWVITEVITKLAHQIDFEQPSGLARRWYPLGPDQPVVLDPLISFGRPTIVGKGVATLNVYDFFMAEGRNQKAACKWLNLAPHEVEAAVTFEQKLAA